MKFNMGCGADIREGWINVDKFHDGLLQPDYMLFDLDLSPWPWKSNCAETVLFNHSLEHMGQDSMIFCGLMIELYRICCDGAEVFINVPHPRHDDFLNDPTHVRPITPDMLALFDRRQCLEWQRQKKANTPLALICKVDFRIVRANAIVDPQILQVYLGDDENIRVAAGMYNNVLKEWQLVLKVDKS